MRVPQSHLRRLMAEDLLELEEVAAVHDPVAGEGMTKVVEADVAGLAAVANARGKGGVLEDLLEDLLEDADGGLVDGAGTVWEDDRATRREAPFTEDRQERIEQRRGADLVVLGGAGCATDAERLDVFNGILLAPHLDLAFDRGFITIADDRKMVVSELLSEPDREALGFHEPLTINSLDARHRHYLL